MISVEEGVRHVRAHWKIIALGQLLSFFTASAGAAQASLHLKCNASAPAFSIATTFFLLSLFLIPMRSKYREPTFEQPHLFGIPLRVPVAVYFFIAVMQVQAYYWTLSAFQYTTLTSVVLLDAVALPSAMILSRFLLKRRYTRVHLLGAAVCFAGVFINMLGDYKSDDIENINDPNNPYPDKLIGDIFAFTGAVMIGVIHVFSEVIVSDFSGPTEYLGAVSVFAFPIALTQSLILERAAIANIFRGNDCSGSLFFISSVLFTSLAFSGTAWLLYLSEANLLNLSLLTTDLWAATFSVVAEGIVPPSLFWVSLVVIFTGVFIYEMATSPVAHDHGSITSYDLNRDENLRPGISDFEMT